MDEIFMKFLMGSLKGKLQASQLQPCFKQSPILSGGSSSVGALRRSPRSGRVSNPSAEELLLMADLETRVGGLFVGSRNAGKDFFKYRFSSLKYRDWKGPRFRLCPNQEKRNGKKAIEFRRDEGWVKARDILQSSKQAEFPKGPQWKMWRNSVSKKDFRLSHLSEGLLIFVKQNEMLSFQKWMSLDSTTKKENLKAPMLLKSFPVAGFKVRLLLLLKHHHWVKKKYTYEFETKSSLN